MKAAVKQNFPTRIEPVVSRSSSDVIANSLIFMISYSDPWRIHTRFQCLSFFLKNII